jgi:hypothetical protein
MVHLIGHGMTFILYLLFAVVVGDSPSSALKKVLSLTSLVDFLLDLLLGLVLAPDREL